ncbi:MAG TPA: RecQ family ATP-dependent DNA helicase, partial [bacterium]|nr:RecQ family ATP-dependent DNA helicase [bacterium]
SFNRPNLFYDIRPKSDSFGELLALLRSPQYKDRATIIYCFSRKDTEALAAKLRAQHLVAEAYHAGLEAQERHAIQDRFIRDETPIITATIAFGMGIDKSDIRLVVHYALPQSIEGYYQETGRAGRDGLPAGCVMFYSYADKFKQEYFIAKIEDDTERRHASEKLNRMVAFCESFLCRRKFLLEYFGETYEQDNCACCDRCVSSGETFDASVIGRAVLDCVRALGGRFGGQYIIDILRGSRSARVRTFGHERLPMYGQGRDFSPAQLREIINRLLEKGLLAKADGEYPTIGLSPAGRDCLAGDERLLLPQLRPTATAAGGGAHRPAARTRHAAAHDDELFQTLRQLRKRLADQRGVPPFIIFADTSLHDMANRLPQDDRAFLAITGVGEQKLKQYGSIFMTTIGDYLREHPRTSTA